MKGHNRLHDDKVSPAKTHPGDALETDAAIALQAVESLGAGVLVVGRDLHVRYRNGLASTWLEDGSDVEAAFAGVRFLDSFDGWEVEIQRILQTGARCTFDCMLGRGERESSPTLFELTCMPLVGGATAPSSGIVIVIEENSHRAGAEERMAVIERLASIGKLAACVAHELNNPLDGILRYINLAIRVAGGSDPSKLKTYLDESRVGVERMMQIIGDLLEFSRSTHGAFDEMGINELVEQAVRAAAARADENGVIIAVDLQSRDMPSVSGGRLSQVMGNLIRNGIDAMPDGGTLTISAGVVGREVVVRIADTGHGLPDDVDRVFEPFFTTKEPGKGTGLGLAICKEFIGDLNGTLSAVPGEEGGAVFTIRLPLDQCRGGKEGHRLADDRPRDTLTGSPVSEDH